MRPCRPVFETDLDVSIVKSKNTRTWERLGRGMTTPLNRAFDAIEDLAIGVLPDADVRRVGTEDLAIENGGKRAVVRLTHALLEDFESTLDGGLPV
jgi:hypothetical protein